MSELLNQKLLGMGWRKAKSEGGTSLTQIEHAAIMRQLNGVTHYAIACLTAEK